MLSDLVAVMVNELVDGSVGGGGVGSVGSGGVGVASGVASGGVGAGSGGTSNSCGFEPLPPSPAWQHLSHLVAVVVNELVVVVGVLVVLVLVVVMVLVLMVVVVVLPTAVTVEPLPPLLPGSSCFHLSQLRVLLLPHLFII